MALTRVVAITGCDSGLGWSLAARMAREGLVTIAGMYNGTDTEAAKALKKYNAQACHLDVTSVESVKKFRNYVKEVLDSDPNYRLHAIVNNAGVMTIGDYEWQTPDMIESTINVNLLGAMKVVAAFLPDLRMSAQNNSLKPRVINVASHCGLQPLPGFGPYSASKAGILAWTTALRYEHHRHGLTAISFVPGGFIGSSNILSTQANKGLEMLENLNNEQKHFYAKRITTLTDYLQAVSTKNGFNSLKDENITNTFMKAVWDTKPKSLYKVESWRYSFYYNLLKLPLPETLQIWIIKQFLSFPEPK